MESLSNDSNWMADLNTAYDALIEGNSKPSELPIDSIIAGFQEALQVYPEIDAEGHASLGEICEKVEYISSEIIDYYEDHPIEDLVSKVTNFINYGEFLNTSEVGLRLVEDFKNVAQETEDAEEPMAVSLGQDTPQQAAPLPLSELDVEEMEIGSATDEESQAEDAIDEESDEGEDEMEVTGEEVSPLLTEVNELSEEEEDADDNQGEVASEDRPVKSKKKRVHMIGKVSLQNHPKN